ncbi:hypothetical protein D9611_004049 [Ephemerocybe angulata]|uniref:Uncharacterized protein n=1 Tax=Ephemerocybe angulata TaxID=980116 RepID=A0A8H5BM00_9AGAR|nr:hypothetical protein D9611_004049 [Tulosesus angulatus]
MPRTSQTNAPAKAKSRERGKAPARSSAKPLPDPTTPVGPPRTSGTPTLGSATPRSIREQAGDEKLTDLRPIIAKYMKKETLYCSRDDFFEHYFIPSPASNVLNKVLETMRAKAMLVPRPKGEDQGRHDTQTSPRSRPSFSNSEPGEPEQRASFSPSFEGVLSKAI